LPNFTRLKISIEVSGDSKLVSDDKVLYSILQNLIENAIKYQDESRVDSWLKVSVQQTAKEAVFVFEDNGAGISEAHLHKIFEMFYKVNDKSIGSGLGLYILKQAIQKLSGTVQVNSIQGQGTKFTVVIPNAEMRDEK